MSGVGTREWRRHSRSSFRSKGSSVTYLLGASANTRVAFHRPCETLRCASAACWMGWSNRRPCSCASASTKKVICTRCAAFGNGAAQLRASPAGEISIRDVRLCIAALDSASSPFRIKQATVSTDATCCAAPSQSAFAQRSRAFVSQVGLLSISIPWWNPYTQPLIVTLDQVVLLRIQYRSYAPILRANPTRETPASNAPSLRSHPRLLASTSANRHFALRRMS